MDDAGLLCCLRVFERKELKKQTERDNISQFPNGLTVRLRQGATPSIFKFPDHLSKQPSSSRLSRTSNRAIEESPHTWSNTPVRGTPALFDQPISDHQYALDPVKAKEKLAVSQENVEKFLGGT
ncbi:hypothetical protein UPYG_G00246410 [Umbra pygmaea]|uniref:Uncharacterized protein n=1 Tax=Umbra pygmaea TaxID=75934 RepID=A0ABD0WGB2_UMBPY